MAVLIKSLYNFNIEKDKYQKVFLDYNDTLSAYTLVLKLKALSLNQSLHHKPFTFALFPDLLQSPPLFEKQELYTYRENYRISRSDKVTTKIMFRYKINDLELGELLTFIEKDDFLLYFKKYLESENLTHDPSFISVTESINVLRLGDKKLFNKIKLNFYIVYSFILKLHNMQENIYEYSVVKDQFRVHYHINQLDYTSLENLEKKEQALAQLIYIYFLARLKKID